MIEINNKKKETDLPLFKHGVYKLSIHSLYIHLPCTENTKAVANKRQTGRAVSESELISKGSGIQVFSNWKENLFLYHQNTEKVTVFLSLWVFKKTIIVDIK